MKYGKITTHNFADQRFQSGQQYFQLPGGSTSDRPVDPQTGMLRFNLDEGSIEGYTRGKWSSFLATSDFRIPGVQFPEDENVTIASLATLLRQFQRTVVGGVDVLGQGVGSPDDTSLVGMPIAENGSGAPDTPLEWVSTVTRGSVIGYMDEAGKGETYIQCRAENSSASSGYQSFEAIIDPYSLSGFADTDRWDYLYDYFINLYGYRYTLNDYVNRGSTCSITPAWDLLDPWNDQNYGKFRVHLSLVKTGKGGGAERGFGFAKWFIKMVRFRNFRLQNVPELAPGGGSEPMPDVAEITITPNDYKQFNLVNYLLRKYPTWSGGPAEVFLHIQPDSVIYSATPGTPALNLAGMPSGSRVYVRNEGYILGHGGRGGSGGGLVTDTSGNITEQFAENGGTGGTAIELDGNITMYFDNRNGYVYTGGGGGGGGPHIPLFQDIPDHISVLAGGGGGAGGSEQTAIPTGLNGGGVLDQNPNDPAELMLMSSTLDGQDGNVSVYRSGGGVDISGSTGSNGGDFILQTLSGAPGGNGGAAGVAGEPGTSVTGTPNIMIIGWQTADDVDGEDRLAFGDEDLHLKNGSHGGQTWTDVENDTHDINWLTAWLLPQLTGNGDVDYTIVPFSNKEVLIDSSGEMVSIPVEVGFVVVSTAVGSAAADWSWSVHGHFQNNGLVYPPQNAAGATDQTYVGGNGGSPGFSIEGTSSIVYSMVDPDGKLYTPGDESTYGGTIVGLQRS